MSNIIKAMLIGPTAIGKTRMLGYILHNQKLINPEEFAHLDEEYRIQIHYNGEDYELNIVDTPGMSEYESFVSSIMKNANIIILLLNNPDETYITMYEENARPGLRLIIVEVEASWLESTILLEYQEKSMISSFPSINAMVKVNLDNGGGYPNLLDEIVKQQSSNSQLQSTPIVENPINLAKFKFSTSKHSHRREPN